MLNRNLVAMLNAQDKRLAAALEESRNGFQHNGLRGDVVESAFRDFLSKHLPRHFTVGTGEVIDINDRRSSQTDVVVTNTDQPFQTGLHDPGIFIIEGVSAAGEIKSRLTVADLDDTIAKGSRFKTLRNLPNQGGITWKVGSDPDRFHRCPPYFLFATESVVAIPTLIGSLQAAPLVPPPDGEGPALSPLDAVFILGRGSAINFGDGRGTLTATLANGERATGWQWTDNDAVIADFLIWLSSSAPRPTRFQSPAMEYLVRHRASRQQLPGQRA